MIFELLNRKKELEYSLKNIEETLRQIEDGEKEANFSILLDLNKTINDIQAELIMIKLQIEHG